MAMAELQLVADLPGHTEPAWQVAFNPTRNLLASCSTDKTFRLYSFTPNSTWPTPNDPKPDFQLVGSTPTEHKKTIRSIAWAPSGRTLATGSFDSTVGVWEEVEEEDDPMGQPEWECVTTLEGHENECKGVGFSSDGGLLASCSRDKSVWVWEVQPDADFECIAVMMEHSQDVKAISWHPKEEILASASYDSHIHLMFDDPDGDWCIFQKLHPKLPPSALTIQSPSPGLVAALSRTEEEKAIEELDIPPLEEDETVWSLAWSPCGKYLASGGDQGGIRIWRRRGSNPDSLFEEIIHTAAHSRSVFSLSWSEGKDGLGLLASAGGDGKIIIWQITEGVTIRPIAAVRNAHGVSDVNSVAWCTREDGRGKGMLASCGDDGSVKVWRVAMT